MVSGLQMGPVVHCTSFIQVIDCMRRELRMTGMGVVGVVSRGGDFSKSNSGFDGSPRREAASSLMK